MKSYVGMGHDECPICGAKHSEVVLIDKRVRNTLDHDQTVGISECPECVGKIDNGYVALVAIDESKSKHPYTPTSAYRTGNIVWIKRDSWGVVFNVPAPSTKFAYCGEDVVGKILATAGTMQ